jgi:hypothetical protein
VFLGGANPVFGDVHRTLRAAGALRRLEDLPLRLSYAAGSTPPSEPITADMPLREIIADEARGSRASTWGAQLNEKLDMSVETYGDLLTALTRLGLIARLDDGTERLAPIPQYTPVWDVFDIDDDDVRSTKWQADLTFYRTIPDDLLHLIVWAPGRTLHATPMQMATRLALSVDDVLGSLRLLATTSSHGHLHTNTDLEQVAAYDELDLRLVGDPPRMMRWPRE